MQVAPGVEIIDSTNAQPYAPNTFYPVQWRLVPPWAFKLNMMYHGLLFHVSHSLAIHVALHLFEANHSPEAGFSVPTAMTLPGHLMSIGTLQALL